MIDNDSPITSKANLTNARIDTTKNESLTANETSEEKAPIVFKPNGDPLNVCELCQAHPSRAAVHRKIASDAFGVLQVPKNRTNTCIGCIKSILHIVSMKSGTTHEVKPAGVLNTDLNERIFCARCAIHCDLHRRSFRTCDCFLHKN